MQSVWDSEKELAPGIKLLYKGYKTYLQIRDEEPQLLWDDEFTVECPEDCTWGRMISDVFYAGLEAGQAIDKC